MSDENDNAGEGDAGAAGDGGTGGSKKKEPKTLTILVLRAVDAYHHRGATLTVPNDEYHQGLVKQGNVRVVA